MTPATARSVMSLHRKQMTDALRIKGHEDMLAFHYAAFRHRELMREHSPSLYSRWAEQNPEMAAQDAAR